MKAIATANVGRLQSMTRILVVMLLSSVVLVPSAFAERFHLRQSLTPETNSANSTKRRGEPAKVTGSLESRGVGILVFQNQEHVVNVTLKGTFEGQPDSMRGKTTQTVTLADGGSLTINFEFSSSGKRFTGKITGGSGSGKFQGAQITGTITGNAIDPSISYMELQGDISGVR